MTARKWARPFSNIGELVDYLKELPRDLPVATWLHQDDSFIVLVNSEGVALVKQDHKGDYRSLDVRLPPRT